MDSTQYMLVRVKIFNEAMPPPDDKHGNPTPNSTIIFETGKILTKNETVYIPFNWSVLHASNSTNSLIITKMSCSDSNVTITSAPNVALTKDAGNIARMKIVFELWLYDANLKTPVFNVGSWDEPQIVWNQIWVEINTK
jgi:hypothetical protein